MKQLKNVSNNIFLEKQPYVTYGFMSEQYGGKHYGADMTAGIRGADYVVADEDGVIEYVKDSVKTTVSSISSQHALGNNIKLRHSATDMSRYCHLAYGSICVKKGDIVRKGQILGYMGDTGYTFGAHLHFERWIGNERQDPEPFITGKREYTVEQEYRYHQPNSAQFYVARRKRLTYFRKDDTIGKVGEIQVNTVVAAIPDSEAINGTHWLMLAENGLFTPLKKAVLFFTDMGIKCALYESSGKANIYEYPSLLSKKIGKLNKRDRVYRAVVKDIKASNIVWARVLYNGKLGYMNAKFLGFVMV